jgi:hypothetical protein
MDYDGLRIDVNEVGAQETGLLMVGLLTVVGGKVDHVRVFSSVLHDGLSTNAMPKYSALNSECRKRDWPKGCTSSNGRVRGSDIEGSPADLAGPALFSRGNT